MPRGDKSSYTSRQKRKAEHIEEGYRERGVGRDEAERRAWATVNKQEGGGRKRGSGRKRAGGPRKTSSSGGGRKRSSSRRRSSSSSRRSTGRKRASRS